MRLLPDSSTPRRQQAFAADRGEKSRSSKDGDAETEDHPDASSERDNIGCPVQPSTAECKCIVREVDSGPSWYHGWNICGYWNAELSRQIIRSCSQNAIRNQHDQSRHLCNKNNIEYYSRVCLETKVPVLLGDVVTHVSHQQHVEDCREGHSCKDAHRHA